MIPILARKVWGEKTLHLKSKNEQWTFKEAALGLQGTQRVREGCLQDVSAGCVCEVCEQSVCRVCEQSLRVPCESRV